MKKILLASLIFTATLVASRDSNVAALKLYCASRLAQGQPVEQVFFYLKLKEAALKQLNPYKLATGITGIEKLDGLNIALRGYLVNWDANTIGLAFEHQRALLPKLAAVYRQEGAQLWDVEVTDEPTRGVAVQQIKVVLSARGTKLHHKFKRSTEYSPDKTGIKPLDKLNATLAAAITEIFWNSAGNVTFVLRFKNPMKERVLESYTQLISQDEADIASVERHDDLFQE